MMNTKLSNLIEKAIENCRHFGEALLTDARGTAVYGEWTESRNPGHMVVHLTVIEDEALVAEYDDYRTECRLDVLNQIMNESKMVVCI